MKLVPMKQAQAKVLNALADKKLRSLTLATFKKDRSVALHREGDGWMLDETGFENASTPLPTGPAGKRLVKEAFKREFPRSNKLYMSEVLE